MDGNHENGTKNIAFVNVIIPRTESPLPGKKSIVIIDSISMHILRSEIALKLIWFVDDAVRCVSTERVCLWVSALNDETKSNACHCKFNGCCFFLDNLLKTNTTMSFVVGICYVFPLGDLFASERENGGEGEVTKREFSNVLTCARQSRFHVNDMPVCLCVSFINK